MSVLYVNAPSFAVALERLEAPSLRRRPLVIAAQMAPRAPILSVSPEAHALGARKGLKLVEVKGLDPKIRILPARHRLYEKAQEKLAEVMDRFTPLFQADRLGSFFLNMDGSERLFGKTLDAAGKIQREVKRVLSLKSTIGAGGNKLVSRIAAKVVRPQGLCDVFPGSEAAFLAPLELGLLPVTREIEHPELFRELGLSRIGDLEPIPAKVLIRVFGRLGERLKLQALGVDPRLVERPETEETISQEILLNPETNDDRGLLLDLWDALQRLAHTLRRRELMAAEGRLKGFYNDQQRIEERWALSPPTNLDFSLFRSFRVHWERFLKRRVALRSLEVILGKLCPDSCQLEFEGNERERRLLGVLDHLRGKYGRQVIQIAIPPLSLGGSPRPTPEKQWARDDKNCHCEEPVCFGLGFD